jgi:hypothetical protein
MVKNDLDFRPSLRIKQSILAPRAAQKEGDCINALLSGCRFNLRKLLRAFSCALQNWLSGLVFKLRTGLQPFRGLFATA